MVEISTRTVLDMLGSKRLADAEEQRAVPAEAAASGFVSVFVAAGVEGDLAVCEFVFFCSLLSLPLPVFWEKDLFWGLAAEVSCLRCSRVW